MKRITAAAVAMAMLLGGCAFNGGNTSEAPGETRNITAAVVAVQGTAAAEAAYSQLENGIMANIDVQMLTPTQSINGNDIIYLSSSVRNEQGFDFEAVEDYVYNGGAVVLDNSLVLNFSNEFLGASELVKLEGCPDKMNYPEGDGDYSNIQELLYDYTSVLCDYTNYEELCSYQYGYGMIPSTAQTIAEYNGTAVYTVNRYGSGYVFLTNPMLPSAFSVSDLDENEDGEPLAFTTVAAENMLRSYYAEYVSKKKYGFAVERTFGSYATRPAAWELHYEDITGIQNNALERFAEIVIEKGQIPSYTLVRNTYTWFKRAESVTYLLDDGTGYKSDPYEGAYCSGTHIVSSGAWLELDSYDDTESYFEDDKQYTKRAYPFPIDWNEDGKLDFICGSADGRFYYYEGYGMEDNYETGVATIITDGSGDALSVGAYSSPVIFDIDGDGRGELISGSESGVIKAFRSLKTDDNDSSLAFEYVGDVLDTGLTDSMISSGDINGDGVTDLAVGSRSGELRVYYGSSPDGYNIVYGDYVNVASDEVWASPCIYNGKLYSGTLEGYIACYEFNGEYYEHTGYLEYDDVSRRGNSRITIGMNSVPRFADINNDGIDDIICGSLEYGMAYPIDSPYFPYKDQLKEQVQFCKDNYLYLGVHGMTHRYATPEHEQRELEYHKKAFEEYGIDWNGKGINQHTWYTSGYGYDGSEHGGFSAGYNGSYMAQYDSGLLWNSGSMTPGSEAVPQTCAENTLPLPMYVSDSDFLLMQVSNTPHGNGAYSYVSVKYDMPMLFYNHCDYVYDAELGKEQLEMADKVEELTEKYNYMFVREDQMAKAAAAVYNTDIKAELKDNAIVISGSVRDEGAGLYDERYADSVGVKLVFAYGIRAEDYSSDASVWRVENGYLYTSIAGGASIRSGVAQNEIRIEQINIPADIKISRKSAVIDFLDDGLMCVQVKGDAYTSSKGWTAEQKNGSTVFTKHGKADKLKIKK